MADSHRFPPARGDEAELFRAFNDRLMSTVARATLSTTPHTIEDACAFAWMELMRKQPERSEYQGWLVVVARREAWRLERQRHGAQRLVQHPIDEIELASDAPSPVEEVEIQHDVDEALGVITQLRPRLQRVALLRALQFSKSEIADLTGDSVGRVDKLVSTASQQIQEILSARLPSRQQLSPRAERLWDLEHESPRWLVDQIGRPPRPSRKGSGSVELRRAWRRAAIALDDYRRAVGAETFASSGLSQPADRALEPAHAKALCAVDDCALLRGSGREREHER